MPERSKLCPATGYRLPATGYRLPATGYRLPATGYRLPAPHPGPALPYLASVRFKPDAVVRAQPSPL
jgi:hypothetical protein